MLNMFLSKQESFLDMLEALYATKSLSKIDFFGGNCFDAMISASISFHFDLICQVNVGKIAQNNGEHVLEYVGVIFKLV